MYPFWQNPLFTKDLDLVQETPCFWKSSFSQARVVWYSYCINLNIIPHVSAWIWVGTIVVTILHVYNPVWILLAYIFALCSNQMMKELTRYKNNKQPDLNMLPNLGSCKSQFKSQHIMLFWVQLWTASWFIKIMYFFGFAHA